MLLFAPWQCRVANEVHELLGTMGTVLDKSLPAFLCAAIPKCSPTCAPVGGPVSCVSLCVRERSACAEIFKRMRTRLGQLRAEGSMPKRLVTFMSGCQWSFPQNFDSRLSWRDGLVILLDFKKFFCSSSVERSATELCSQHAARGVRISPCAVPCRVQLPS